MVGFERTNPLLQHTIKMSSTLHNAQHNTEPCYCGYHHDDVDRFFDGDDGEDDAYTSGYMTGCENNEGYDAGEMSAIEQNLTNVMDVPEFQPLDDLLKPIPMEDFLALECAWVVREEEIRTARMKALEDSWLMEMLGNGRKQKLLDELKKKVTTATSRLHLWVSLENFNSATWSIKGEYKDTDGTVYASVEEFVEKKGYHETVHAMYEMDGVWAHAEYEKYMLLTKSNARKRLATAFDPLLFYVRVHTQCVDLKEPTVWQHAVTLEYWPNGVPARLRGE